MSFTRKHSLHIIHLEIIKWRSKLNKIKFKLLQKYCVASHCRLYLLCSKLQHIILFLKYFTNLK